MRQHAILAVFCFIGLLIASSLSLIASRYFLSQVRKSEKHLEQRVNERTKEIETLQNLATQLTACNSKKEALEVIKLITSILLPRFAGALALYNSSKDKLEVVENWNGRWQGEKIYSPDQCWALRSGQTHFGDPRAGNMTCNHSDSQEDKMLCIPIVAQGMTYGVLHFSSSRKTEWTPEEYQLTSAVAEHASLTLASLESRESLRQQAIRDPLTGLYNRRYLFETIEQELSRASRRNQSIGILMVDIDHFKKFNDEFGHDIGDFILSEFGRLIKMIIRNEDIACRFGGEEFTILLPETGRDEAFRVAEKIRIKIRDYDFILKNRSYGPIKLSVGVVSFPENGKTADHLLKMADNALYEAKQAGRDRVVLAENLNKNTG
jgi:diguanylate cyclase (GGDEF)-like protein